MSKISLKVSDSRTSLQHKRRWSEKEAKLKPFGFCCSMDRFDSLSRYDQQMPPYKSSLTAITSVHECPVSKMRMDFFIPRFTREKRRLAKMKVSEAGDQQPSKNDRSYHFQIDRNNRSLKWYLEDEIALAKDIFWSEKQRIYNEECEKAITIAKKKQKSSIEALSNLRCPRWYQDLSLNQMKNLINLENIMRIDYEERITKGTQTTLATIGVTSTFFKLKPNVIRELHTSCDLNSVHLLQEVYKILTGSGFQEEEYKKFYDCNERIILSAIAFLTLPEAVEELHKRLPAITAPRLPPKPKPPVCITRQKHSCPYKEELFKCPDWVSYRNDLREWRKRHRLLPIPKIILPSRIYRRSPVDNETSSEISERRDKDIYAEHPEEIDSKKLQKISVDKFHHKDTTNVDQQARYDDQSSSSEKDLDVAGSEIFDIPRLPDENKKFDFTITGFGEEPGAVEYKICGMLKSPGASKRSWLREKEARYVIAGASEDPPTCPVTYEITGVANVTPINSDERFFAVLKLGNGPRKIYPAGRENLSKNWQEWLQNADEEFRRLEKDANKLIDSMRAVTKTILPGPICDDCCSCRQTRKTREKLRHIKTPYLLIDNVLQDEDEIKYIAGSIVMHSPGSSPSGSAVNLLEMIASRDEIKTNIIINGITDENGKTQFYISGIQKDKIHIPSQVSQQYPPAPQPVRNVPPCACVIRQMLDEDASPSASKDDIPTKDEGVCLGKKYRPDELAAYSCKMYPSDKSCKRNPFAKDVMRMIKRKWEDKEEAKDDMIKTEATKMIKEQFSEKKIIKRRKRDRFIPDPDYPAYDDPWNILRTAPSEQVETDYEKSLKLTPPALPASLPSTSLPSTQDRRKDISALSKEAKKSSQDTAIKRIDQEEVAPSLPKRTQRKGDKQEQRIKDKNKTSKHKLSTKTVINEKNIKSSSKRSKFADNTRKRLTKSLPVDKSIRRQQINKTEKMRGSRIRASMKRGRKKNIIEGEADEPENRKREMTRLKAMMKSPAGVSDIQPVILPWERAVSRSAELEEKSEEIDDSSALIDEEESREAAEKGPCGWRTKSEQKLPAKKTLVYLCEPDYPLETIAVRSGGRPCRCRENRSKKKILMYNVGGLVNKIDRIGSRRQSGKSKRLREENRIIDGVVYFTPPVSPRRSDEYIPEYHLFESPYEICVGETADERSKLIMKYSGPKSLVEKARRRPKPCYRGNYIDITEEGIADSKKDIEEARRKLMESKSPEERWTMALKDAALMNHFAQYKDNAKSHRLKMVKPVCECRYERKIVERNEEKMRWKTRQQKLKALRKQPVTHIVDISRPMVPDTKFIISGVKRIPQEDNNADDVKYCITGTVENLSMSSPQQIIDGLKMSTPFATPEPSKEDIPRVTSHRHWSPMNIPPGPLPRRKKEEMERKKRIRDEAFKLIYEGENERDASCLIARQEACKQEKSMKESEENRDARKNNASVEKVPEMLPRLHSPSTKKTSQKAGNQQNISLKKVSKEIAHEKRKQPREATGNAGHQQNGSYKQMIEETEKKKRSENHWVNGDGKLNLTAIMKAELDKMAMEGYVFAKLPKCYLMPQLRDWIMYRKGVAFSETDKENLMQATVAVWLLMKKRRTPKIKIPSLYMTKRQLKKLTYDRAEEMKNKIEEKKAIFHSGIRKSRVSYARSMWGTMELGKFPSASFKKAYFTYMASKEADGHVFRPWMRYEIHERDPKFCCD